MKWISVKDRLPEKLSDINRSKRVLGIEKRGYIRICRCLYYEDEYHGFGLSGITHWMPLPELPDDLA